MITLKKLFLCIALMGCCATAWGRQFTLVIDAGHGGKDPGAVGKAHTEKEFNLAIALMVGKMVEDSCKDVRVVYTRKTDVFVELDERANIANRNKADFFLSIHTNAATNTTARGTETYALGLHRTTDNLAVAMRENSVISMENGAEERYEGFDPRSSESYIMFEFLQYANLGASIKMANFIQRQYKAAGRTNRGVFQAGFLVLRATSMPSVLTEIGYISNPEEEAYLASAEGQKAIASSIFRGFRSYKMGRL